MRAEGQGSAAALAAVELRDVTTEIGGSRALDHLDLRIPAGSVTAVIGAIGISKSALVEHLLGRLLPDEGEVVVLGESTRAGSVVGTSELARAVGIVLRDGGLFSSLSVHENVAFLLRNETNMDAARVDAVVAARLEAVGLTRVASALPNDIALGQRKRAGFARALATDPEIILFDEPEAGLDGARIALLAELIGHVHAHRGGTYILLTQDVTAARRVADHIVLMRRGRVLAAGAPRDVISSDNVRALSDRSGGACN
jgi:phospholipid/cholesterol/gamma-HCH transport system ATP-binding protein